MKLWKLICGTCLITATYVVDSLYGFDVTMVLLISVILFTLLCGFTTIRIYKKYKSRTNKELRKQAGSGVQIRTTKGNSEYSWNIFSKPISYDE